MTQSDESENPIQDSEETKASQSFLQKTPQEGELDKDAEVKVKPETSNYKDYSLCKRLKVDHPFRRRFIHTLWLFWAFVGLGWMVGQMGPSFPDLRLIAQQELDTAAWLFTIFSIGYLIGSFFGGILYDRFNKMLLIAFSTLIMAVSTGVLPWCKWFPLMLVVRFISGIGAGGLDTGGNADLVSLWDEEGRPYMQALHFCFGFGGIISPLVTEPFLAEKECLDAQGNGTDIISTNTTAETLYDSVSMATDALNSSSNGTCEEVYGETYIHFAYLISFFILFSSSLPFFIMSFKIMCNKKPHNMAADKSEIPRPDKLPFKLKVIFLILLSAFMLMYCAVEDTFSGFLATFCIYHFNWSTGTSSYATSTHWASFAFGRFSGIFLIKVFKPVQLFWAYCISVVSSFVGLLIVSLTYTTELVWLFIALAGFSMSIIFPCIFTWTEESILKVTGMISSMFLIAASGGLMLNPLFLGYLMDNFSPMCFVYLLLGESVACFLLFLTIFILVKRYINFASSPKSSDMEIVVSEQEMVPLGEKKME
ncbi:sodium-dependent glucose transporter 1A-like [Mercenaria mercenaria]|uniref:sodium-dependent glucose transporter 1A-like n=1 Tax=Mercenaria mercenaria TaxID=6596 RepID=UPI00234EB51B|nr:sodium-dependent glucose transporter 1A-like [Mercenaria mercenaria]